jgi:hypothetical protein
LALKNILVEIMIGTFSNRTLIDRVENAVIRMLGILSESDKKLDRISKLKE